MKKVMVITESNIGICNANNMVNKFVVTHSGTEELSYAGNLDHTSRIKHKVKPGEYLDVTHTLNAMYDFSSINSIVQIYYYHKVFNEDFNPIIIKSNIVEYSGRSLPIVKRKSSSIMGCDDTKLKKSSKDYQTT